MSINTQKSRERIKRSTLTGVVPTVPVSSDFTDGTWLNTDIRAGEFFYNIPDEKLWIGTNTVPLELTSSIGNTLAQILTNGNTTGGSDIIVSSTDLIKDPTGQTYIDLNTTNFKIMSDDNVNNREAQFNIVNDFGSGSIGVGMSAIDTTNNIFSSFGLDADTPIIQSQLTNTILSTYNSFNIGRHYTEVTNGAGSPSNPSTDRFAFIDIFMIGTNKPNITIGNNVPGGITQSIVLAHTGMGMSTNSSFGIATAYNTVISNIFSTLDNSAMNPVLTSNDQKAGIIIGSQSGQIDAGIYNSVILGGLNNSMTLISSNHESVILGGINNNIGGSICAIIAGQDNINNGFQCIVTGDTNTANVAFVNGIIFGDSNTGNGSNNIIGGDNNQILVGQGNFISGNLNINTSGSGNIISGGSNTNTGSSCIISGANNTNGDDFSIISGFSNTHIVGTSNLIIGNVNINTLGNNNFITGYLNTNTSGSYNIIGGSDNICNVDYSLLIGNAHIMNNPGIMFGINSTNVGSIGLSNASKATTNATPTLLTVDTAGSTSFKIDLDTTYRVELSLLAKDVTTGDAKEWKGFGIIKNVGGTTSLVGGTLTMTSTIGDVSLARATVAVTANNTTDTLDITVTGIAATNIRWNCEIEYVLVK